MWGSLHKEGNRWLQIPDKQELGTLACSFPSFLATFLLWADENQGYTLLSIAVVSHGLVCASGYVRLE